MVARAGREGGEQEVDLKSDSVIQTIDSTRSR